MSETLNVKSAAAVAGAAHCSADFVWIRTAINAGGKLTVKSIMPGKAIYSARMSWPGETDVVGNISMRVTDALQNLDGALMHDAAKEMQDSGAV